MGFLTEYDRCGKKVLCNIVFDKFASWPFRRANNKLRRFLAFILLFILFELLQLQFLLIVKYPIYSSLSISLTAALIASFCIYAINWCYHYSLKKMKEVSELSALGKTLDAKLVSSLRKIVKPWIQFVTSISLTTLCVFIAYLLENNIGPLYYSNICTFSALTLVAFWAIQGVYWSIFTPLLAREIRKAELADLKIKPLYPNKNPILVTISKLLSIYATWEGIIVTMCLLSLLVSRPKLSMGGILYIFAVTFGGVFFTSWTFLYPQYNLAKVVKRVKKMTMIQIENKINKLFVEQNETNSSGFEKLKILVEIYDSIKKGPNTVISLSGFRSFLSSLLVPIIIGVLSTLDWETILHKIRSIILG